MNKQILRNTIFTGLFLMPFVPFLVSSSLFFPFITTKAFAWRVIVEVIFAAWLILAIKDEQYRPKRSLILYSIFIFLAVIGVADLFGVNPIKSFWSNFERMEGYITMLHLGVFFVVISSIFNEENWQKWWKANLIASAIMVIYGLFQLAGAATIHQGGVRVDGTLGNAAYLAVYMLIHIFITLLLASRERKSSMARWLYGVLILGQILILYHTATRGAILGFLGGLLIMALLNIRNREDRLVRKASLGILGVLVVVVGGFALARNSEFVKNSPVLVRFTTISSEEFNSGGRSFVWPMALKGFKERPILGWGQDNFNYIFQKHYQPEMYRVEPWFDRAHNIFLDWMVAGGLLGLLSYLALYFALIYTVWKKDAALSHTEKSILTGLVASYFFHNLFVFDHLVSYVLFFSVLAYLHYRNGGAVLWPKALSSGRFSGLALPVVGVALVLVLYSVNIRPLNTNTSLIEAFKSAQLSDYKGVISNFKKAYSSHYLGRPEVVERLAERSVPVLTSNLSMEEKNEFFTFAKDAVIREAEMKPLDAKYQLLAGSFLASTRSPEEALKYLETAKELIPGKQQVYFEIGSAYIAGNQASKGLELFREAYEMAPDYRESQIIYLIGAIYAGDRTLESRLWLELPEKDIAFEDRIVSAYYSNKRFAEVIKILEMRKRLDPQNAATYDKYIQEVRTQ
jgi:O-antigen ligase